MHCRSPLHLSSSYFHLNNSFLEPELPVVKRLTLYIGKIEREAAKQESQ